MADLVRMLGVYPREDAASRLMWRNRFVVVLAAVPAVFYWFFESPVRMVVAGGVAQALMLPLIGLAAIYLRHTQLPRDMQPAAGHDGDAVAVDRGDVGFALYYSASALF